MNDNLDKSEDKTKILNTSKNVITADYNKGTRIDKFEEKFVKALFFKWDECSKEIIYLGNLKKHKITPKKTLQNEPPNG